MLAKIITSAFGGSVVRHFVDKTLKDTIDEPKVGSVLYTGLLADAMEHTGIYIGNGKIIELNSQGRIVEVTPEEFVDGGTGINIYVSAQGKHPVGSSLIAERAIQYEKEVSSKDYHLLFDNCHMFTAACMVGELDNAHSFLWMVKELAKESLGADGWLVWANPQVCAYTSPKSQYTEQDLLDAQQEHQRLREQNDKLWSDIKAYSKLLREHADNGPSTWFYMTDSRLENYQRRTQELEQLSYVQERKHKDLMEAEIRAEKKVSEIKLALGME
ncbi:hypothetical protein [Vibrio sp. CAU 1672]|uniref:hypothetical protein n=1 Tax=Vibrio sp. CAU 1672 TaxID=3032594 RepID=UPI0023DCDEE8|nr:hypothetical protein [Vibrio sp. CAU 1672]MDF2154520.1 hypothetical protein [Vibrio sp. CAU 1672]